MTFRFTIYGSEGHTCALDNLAVSLLVINQALMDIEYVLLLHLLVRIYWYI